MYAQSSTSRFSLLWLFLFLLVVNGIGAWIGMSVPKGAWFDALQKPAFQPPDWVFAPVWTLLYILTAITGWRVFCVEDDPLLRILWILQLALNYAWPVVFFGLQQLGWALAVCAVLTLTLALFLRQARREDPISSWLMLPVFLWCGFATLLTAALWSLNS